MKFRLFKVDYTVAKKLFPMAFQKEKNAPDDVSPAEIDWFISEDGELWTNDSFESHGWEYSSVSGKEKYLNISEVEVFR